MGTKPPPHLTVVWVTVEQVQHPRTVWTYLLSEDTPVSPIYGTTNNRGIWSDKLCYSYLELFDWLCLYGFTPHPRTTSCPPQRSLT